MLSEWLARTIAVSYTHLDVYKRQVDMRSHKKAFEYRPVGTRDRGRPWKKWSEGL